MTMKSLARLLESTDGLTPTQQVARITTELTHFQDKRSLFAILSQEFPSNNIGLAKAKKWISHIYNIHDDELDMACSAHDDLGEAVYYLDSSAENKEEITLQSVLGLLSMDCSGIDSNSFNIIRHAFLNMGALECKWFIRYWLRTPRNGINEGVVKKILAKAYDKKLADVKKHCNFNSISNVSMYYETNSEPPMNLEHGSFVAPMLAKEVPMNKWPTNRIVDYKYDGNRYQIHKEGDNVIIFNRKGKIVTPQFQDVVEQVRKYDVHTCILDGEIYPINEDGSPAEHKLMATRVHSKNHEEAREKVKVKWVIFDCLKYGKDTIMDLPYSDRVIAIKTFPDQAHRMAEGGDTLAFYNRAINDGFEGIIVKDASLPYEAGKRSLGWAKYKPPRINLDVVILNAKYGEGKRANVFGSYGIGVRTEDRGYVNLGSIGSGFSDSQLVRLTNELRRQVDSHKDGVFYFLPRVVLEVTADLITQDAQGNWGLRFPRLVRIRDDKFVADINTLEDVMEMI
jgi:DNA ligase-1